MLGILDILSIQADVDENLGARFGQDADGVVGDGHNVNAAGHRGVHDVADGQDAVALAEQALGDDLVVDFLLVDEHAGDGRVDRVLSGCERGGNGGLGVLGAVEHAGDVGEKAHWLPPIENGAPYAAAHTNIRLSYPIHGDCMPAFRPSWRNREICCSESASGRIPRETQPSFPQVEQLPDELDAVRSEVYCNISLSRWAFL